MTGVENYTRLTTVQYCPNNVIFLSQLAAVSEFGHHWTIDGYSYYVITLVCIVVVIVEILPILT